MEQPTSMMPQGASEATMSPNGANSQVDQYGNFATSAQAQELSQSILDQQIRAQAAYQAQLSQSKTGMPQQAKMNGMTQQGIATSQQAHGMFSGQMSAISQMVNQQLLANKAGNQQNIPEQMGKSQMDSNLNGFGIEQNFATSAQTQAISQSVLDQQIQAQAAYQAQLYQQQLYQQQIQAQAQLYAQLIQAQFQQSQQKASQGEESQYAYGSKEWRAQNTLSKGNPMVAGSQQSVMVNPNMDGLQREGTVKRWFDDKSSGWIDGDDGENIFVHATDIVGERTKLVQGERVQYEIGWNHRIAKQRAEMVRPLEMVVAEPELLTIESVPGVINIWQPGRNYGYIKYAKGTMFVHQDECPNQVPLPIGTKVKFKIQLNHCMKKKKAVELVVVRGSWKGSSNNKMTDKEFTRAYAEKSKKYALDPSGARLANGERFSPY